MFAQSGARAICICARTMDQLEETRQAISTVNLEVEVYLEQVDVSSEQDVQSFFVNVKNKFGVVDVAVSNAATNQTVGSTIDCDVDEWWKELVRIDFWIALYAC